MNKDLLNELQKCKVATIPNIEEENEIIINKYNNIDLIKGFYYNIKIEDYIINEPADFTLSSNWNRGTKPPENILSIKVEDIQGKMIKVDAIGKESKKIWQGWLPKKAIKILERVE